MRLSLSVLMFIKPKKAGVRQWQMLTGRGMGIFLNTPYRVFITGSFGSS
jgi:hypothetical protein